MKAIVVRAYGGPECLELAEVPVPEPGPGEVRVRVEHAGVNFIDVYTREGVYRSSGTYANRPPFVLGREGGGLVDRLGPGVEGPSPGERVAWCLSPGTYAEYAVVPAWRLVRVPADVEPEVAVASMLQGCTAHYLTHDAFGLGPGHTCLVHAAAGGVGRLLVQLARLRGARVVATAGGAEKAALVRELGADVAVDYSREDFVRAAREATGGRGVDVVYDGVGRATFAGSLAALARRGTLVLFGGASGQVESVSPLALAEAGSVFLTRPHMADYMADAAEVAARAQAMLGLAREGRIRVRIDAVYPLAQAAAAHARLEARATRGKLLLRV